MNFHQYQNAKEHTWDVKYSGLDLLVKYVVFSIQNRWKELSREDQAPTSERSPPNATKITTEKYNGNRVGIENQEQAEDIFDAELSSALQNTADANADKWAFFYSFYIGVWKWSRGQEILLTYFVYKMVVYPFYNIQTDNCC